MSLLNLGGLVSARPAAAAGYRYLRLSTTKLTQAGTWVYLQEVRFLASPKPSNYGQTHASDYPTRPTASYDYTFRQTDATCAYDGSNIIRSTEVDWGTNRTLLGAWAVGSSDYGFNNPVSNGAATVYLEGWNGSTWTTIHTWSGVTSLNAVQVTSGLTSTAYSKHRIRVDPGNGGNRLCEALFWHTTAPDLSAWDGTWGPWLPPTFMTSNSAPSPYSVSATSTYPGGYDAYLAFNNSGASDGWCSNAQSDGSGNLAVTQHLVLDLGTTGPRPLGLYGVQITPYTTYYPQDFSIGVSTDNVNWTTQGSWSGISSGWAAGTPREFWV